MVLDMSCTIILLNWKLCILAHLTDWSIDRIRPLGLVVKRITSIGCYDKIARSIRAEGISFLNFC